jgi:phosphopantetheine--protein transferase-like protein
MVYSCGIDIEEINRFDKHYFQNGVLSNLMYDVFTSREIENFSYFGKKAFLKGFCFKEAFYKAINSDNISWFDVEIFFSNDENRKFIFLNCLPRF